MKKAEYILYTWVRSVKKMGKRCRISLSAKQPNKQAAFPKTRGKVRSRDILTFLASAQVEKAVHDKDFSFVFTANHCTVTTASYIETTLIQQLY